MQALSREQWTIGHLLQRAAETYSDQTCIETADGESRTYYELWSETCRIAAGLGLIGIREGDTVGILAGNTLQAVLAWLSVNCAGATETTINPAYRGALLVHVLRTAEANTLIVEERFTEAIASVEDQLPFLERIIVVGAESVSNRPHKANVLLWQDIAADVPNGWAPLGSYNSIASIIYTSGTTGPAKGVMLTHAQNYLSALHTVKGLRLQSSDVYYCAHPLFHQAGKFLAAQAIFTAGGKLFLDKGFSAPDWIGRIASCGATVTVAHGPMFEMVHAQPESAFDASSKLKRILSCPFPKRIASSFEKRFKVKAVEGYGMTEIGVPCWTSLDDRAPLGSCGKVNEDDFELRIADANTDEPLGSNKVGQILVRPRHAWTTMQGYRGMPERTVEAWRNLWFHTGDAGYLDDDGNLFFVDRLNDRIRRRAESVSSYDIEAAALAHPAVIECAAVGVSSGFESDDDIKLCIVCSVPTPDYVGLLKHLARQLPHFMLPRYIEVLPMLPRTPTNKVKRAELRHGGVSSNTWDRKHSGISVASFYP